LALADGQSASYALTACSGATGGGSSDPGNAGAGGSAVGGGSADAGATPDGAAVNGGSSTRVGLSSSPAMTAGCACAIPDGDPHVFVTVLCLVGCAISVRRRRARRS
jgi:hypothetical protein